MRPFFSNVRLVMVPAQETVTLRAFTLIRSTFTPSCSCPSDRMQAVDVCGCAGFGKRREVGWLRADVVPISSNARLLPSSVVMPVRVIAGSGGAAMAAF